MTGVPRPSHIPRNILLPLTKDLEYLYPRLLWFLLAIGLSNRTRDYSLPYVFCYIRMLYYTTPIGRYGRGWDKERQREERKRVKLRRRSSSYITESTMIDHR
jgi:hypothetical protein